MRILIGLLSVLLSAAAWGANPVTIEQDWTWESHYSKVTSVTISTITPNTSGRNYTGFAYAIRPVGADVSWTVSFTTRTYSPTSTDISSITTVGHFSKDGVSYASEFDSLVMNPTITLYDLSAAATYYVYMTYGERRRN